MYSPLCAALLVALSIGAPFAAHGASEQYEGSRIRFLLPDGFVRLQPGSVTWAAADDPQGQRCAIAMTEVEFDGNAVRSFELGWRRLAFTRRYQVPPPIPVVTQLQGGYTIGYGAWQGRTTEGAPYLFAIGNVSRAEAGHMLVAYGVAPTCQAKFAALLQTVEIVDAAVMSYSSNTASNSAGQTLGNFYRDANRIDQQRADQRMRNQQAQDRLFQQRAFERQAQDRLMQQQELARQAQQRIQDSYRRR